MEDILEAQRREHAAVEVQERLKAKVPGATGRRRGRVNLCVGLGRRPSPRLGRQVLRDRGLQPETLFDDIYS